MIACIPAYLLIGEAIAITTLVAASEYNRRFVQRPQNAYIHWKDLIWVAVIQLTWPLTTWAIVPYSIQMWRRAVRNEECLCGHPRKDHGEDYVTSCNAKRYRPEWLVRGEGEEFILCECPKFTAPSVRPGR